jgi:hypothetical protein
VTTPSATTSAPTLPSTAQSALDQATALHAAAPAPEPEPSAEEAEVEAEEDGKPERRSLSWADALKQVPPDIRQLMQSMQGDYTKKTQQLASERKNFLAEREALLKGQESLKTPAELPEFDPFNESTINARIEAEVNKRLNAVLEPMKREYEQVRAEESYTTFLSEHTDLKTDVGLRSEVQHLLEANAGLDLETAYWAAKGKQARQAAAKATETDKARRSAEREAAQRGTGLPRKGAAAAPPAARDLRKMSSADIFAMAQSLHRR